jgi:predicted esterase
MIQRKHVFYLPASSLLLLLFIFLTPSCNCNKSKSGKSDAVVVLLHGLGHVKADGKSGLDQLKTKLEEDLTKDNNKIEVIAPVRLNSFEDSLDDQVEALRKLLKTHKESELILYGHSQGAVLAAYLWCKHSNDFKIKALILDRGPLAGFDPLSSTNEQNTLKLKVLIPKLILAANTFDPQMGKILAGLDTPAENFDEDGVQDLKPSSAVITEILRKLPNVDIPVVLITAKSQNFLSDSIENPIKNNVNTIAGHWSNWCSTDAEFKEKFPDQAALQTFLSTLDLNALFGSPNDGFISVKSQDLNGATHANIERIGGANYSGFPHGFTIEGMKGMYEQLLEKIKSHIIKN